MNVFGIAVMAYLGVPLDINAASSFVLMASVWGHVAHGTLIAWMLAAMLTSLPQMFVLEKLYNSKSVMRLLVFYTGFIGLSGFLMNCIP